MSSEITTKTEEWINTRFALEATDPGYLPVFRRFFLKRLSEVNEEFGVNSETDHEALMDAVDPESETCREFIETFTSKEFARFLEILKEGFSAAYSETYAKSVSDGGQLELASADAFEQLAGNLPKNESNPAYSEAFAACRRRGASEEFSSHCANLILEDWISFSRAFEFTEKHFKAMAIAQSLGYAAFGSRLYTEGIALDWNPPFAELYAKCAESLVADGRSEQEAERVAWHYTDLFDGEGGSFDEDYEYHKVANDHIMVLAEANHRYTTSDGSKERFSNLFDQVSQITLRDWKQPSTIWFQKIEGTVRRILSGEISFNDIPSLPELHDDTEDDYPKEKFPAFDKMDEKAFKKFQPNSDLEYELREKESEFRDWCREQGEDLDPTDPDVRARYKEICAELGDAFWDSLDDDDRDGWTDNMNRE